MTKRYYFVKDGLDLKDQYFKIAGIALPLVGIYFLIDPSQNSWIEGLVSSSAGFILFIGLICLAVGFIVPFVVKHVSTKLEISNNFLYVKNQKQPQNQIAIPDIQMLAQNYQVYGVRGRAVFFPYYNFFVRQWGYSIKTKDGQVWQIGANIPDFPALVADLQAISPVIQEDQSWSAASKQQADSEAQKSNAQEKEKAIYNSQHFWQK